MKLEKLTDKVNRPRKMLKVNIYKGRLAQSDIKTHNKSLHN